jgi:hypothetical protein
MSNIRRLLRMDRMLERQKRHDRRTMARLREWAAYGDKIERRQQNDPALPPMPFDFVEIERRRKEGKS